MDSRLPWVIGLIILVLLVVFVIQYTTPTPSADEAPFSLQAMSGMCDVPFQTFHKDHLGNAAPYYTYKYRYESSPTLTKGVMILSADSGDPFSEIHSLEIFKNNSPGYEEVRFGDEAAYYKSEKRSLIGGKDFIKCQWTLMYRKNNMTSSVIVMYELYGTTCDDNPNTCASKEGLLRMAQGYEEWLSSK